MDTPFLQIATMIVFLVVVAVSLKTRGVEETAGLIGMLAMFCLAVATIIIFGSFLIAVALGIPVLIIMAIVAALQFVWGLL